MEGIQAAKNGETRKACPLTLREASSSRRGTDVLATLTDFRYQAISVQRSFQQKPGDLRQTISRSCQR